MAVEKLTSEGMCRFCGKMFAKAGINRHLKGHLEKCENPKGVSYLVKIETLPRYGKTPYFLSLWVNGNAKMQDIDQFLREIWLECCGHLSAFANPKHRREGNVWGLSEALELLEDGKMEEYEDLMEETAGEVPKNREVDKVFHKDLKLEYQYDFGNTTELLLTVIDEFPIVADDDIVLLSRNEPLKIMCKKCKKNVAEHICAVHLCEEESVFCEECADIHAEECPDFDEYANYPIVNSPRMGVCAYEGGIIDTERDIYCER